MELEWLNPNILENSSTNSREDSLYLQQDLFQSYVEHSDLVEYSHSGNHTVLTDDGPFIFDYGLVTNNECDYENNDESCPTDTSSSFSSDSALSNKQQFKNGSERDWIIDNPNSLRNNFECAGSSADGINTSTSCSNKHYENARRSYCLGNSNSKNAVAARDNRLKKKKYITSLEETVQNLRAQNDYLLKQSNKTRNTLCGLRSEVSYLRRVIENQSVLSAILKNVMKTPGIKLSTSLNSTFQSNDCKTERVAHGSSDYVGSGPSTDCAQYAGAINSSSQTDQITASSSVYSKKKSKQNSKGKKVDAHEEIRMRYDQVLEKNIKVDIEGCGDSDESTDSFSQDDKVTGGICLHVSGRNVSLELCSHCNKNANLRVISDHSYFKQ